MSKLARSNFNFSLDQNGQPTQVNPGTKKKCPLLLKSLPILSIRRIPVKSNEFRMITVSTIPIFKPSPRKK